MALATLSIDLVAQLAELQEGFDKATRMSEKYAREMDRRLSALKSGAAAFGAALGGAFSLTAISEFVSQTVNGIDALNDLKDATGASIENISALEDIGARTGTSYETVASTLVKFNKVLGETTKEGSEAGRVLKGLGLDAAALRQMDPAEALRVTAEAMARFADDGEKARAIQVLFGKSVQEAAPFLKDLAEAGRLVATVTTKQAEEAEKFNKQLARFEKNSKDAGRGIVSSLLPAFNTMIEKAEKAEGVLGRIAAFMEATGFGKGLELVGVNLFGPDSREGKVAELEKQYANIEERLKAGNVSENLRINLLEKQVALRRQISALELPQASYSNEGRSGREQLKIADEVKPAKVSELQKYIEQLERATLSTNDLSEEEKARFLLETGQLGKVTAAQEKYLLLLARGIDLSKKAADLRGPEIDADELKRRRDLEKEFQGLLDATPTAKLQKQLTLERALTEAYDEGRLGVQGSTEALIRYNEVLDQIHPNLVELKDETSDFSKQAAANIQDAFGDTLKRSLKGDFDSIGELWGDLLLDMATQAAAAQLNQYLLGKDFGSTGNLGGLLGDFGSWLKGLGSSSAGSAATSTSTVDLGSLWGMQAYRSRAGAMSAGGQIVNIDNSGQVINVGSGVSRAEVQAAIDSNQARSDASLRRSLRQAKVL